MQISFVQTISHGQYILKSPLDSNSVFIDVQNLTVISKQFYEKDIWREVHTETK